MDTKVLCELLVYFYFSSPYAQFAYFAFMVVTVDSRDNISIATDSKLIAIEKLF
jgi:hypothetical protein